MLHLYLYSKLAFGHHINTCNSPRIGLGNTTMQSVNFRTSETSPSLHFQSMPCIEQLRRHNLCYGTWDQSIKVLKRKGKKNYWNSAQMRCESSFNE